MGKIADDIREKYGDLFDKYYTEGVAEYVQKLFPPNFTGIALDVGAYHSKWLNNTYILEQSGWDVYCIEPNPNCADLLEDRAHVYTFAAGQCNKDNVDFYIYNLGHGPTGEAGATGLLKLNGFYESSCSESVKVDMRTLDWFLETENIDHVDFLSLDTENTEMDILQGIDLDRWSIKVISLEVYDPNLGQDVYMRTAGFKKHPERFVWNDIYYREDFSW